MDLTFLTEHQRTQYRRRVVGFVWQQTARNLLPYLTAAENVGLPMTLDGISGGERERRGRELLELVGLAHRADHRPDALSGGEQQRVAVAIALANRPSILLADEPTGELDTQSSSDLFATLREVNRETGVTIVVLTHDPLVAEQVQRTILPGRTATETLRRLEVRWVGRRGARRRRGACGARPHRPAPASAGLHRGAHARAGPPRPGWRSSTTTSPSGRRRHGATMP